jgi:hypothetical protein
MALFIVTDGIQGGYLADTVIECDSLREARETVEDLIEEYLDDGLEVHGSARDLPVLIEDDSLGRIIEITEAE